MQAMKAAWECPCCGWIEIAPWQAIEEKRDGGSAFAVTVVADYWWSTEPQLHSLDYEAGT
ncbi:hypothetical protein ACPW96_22305 [Micromonospora sp. DT81.3]|uniref:hypothetical protein n=1 Tax=Micromonospora sp. DT81.3 TaxID=3416523 RepID=UPI003CE9FDD8